MLLLEKYRAATVLVIERENQKIREEKAKLKQQLSEMQKLLKEHQVFRVILSDFTDF